MNLFKRKQETKKRAKALSSKFSAGIFSALLAGLTATAPVYSDPLQLELQLVGHFDTIFGGAEYSAKVGNVFYQGIFPGWDGVEGQSLNNNTNPATRGILAIDVSNPANPAQIAHLEVPEDVSVAGVEGGTLLNGTDIVAGGLTPAYCWALLPDISTDLNPKVGPFIQGQGGARIWDVSNPQNPQVLAEVHTERDLKGYGRRAKVLLVGRTKVDVEDGTKTFEQTAHPFAEYAFQSPDDAVIRTSRFQQDGKDYLVLNTISADLGLAIFDITNPSCPEKVVNYSPAMNYMLQVENVCANCINFFNPTPYSERYFEDLNPIFDCSAVNTLAQLYWNRNNDHSFEPGDYGLFRSGPDENVTLHTKYIPEERAILVSSNSDFYYISVDDIEHPVVISNLSDRNAFPTLKTPDQSFDLVEYYTRSNASETATKEGIAGYHVSDYQYINDKLIVAIDHDNYYYDATGATQIATGVSVWDYSNPAAPKLLSFIEHPVGEAHTVKFSQHNNVPVIHVANLITGLSIYDLSDTENPTYVTGHTGTFPLSEIIGIPPSPGEPYLSLPNYSSGFTSADFVNYPEFPEAPFRTLATITNLPGLPPELGGTVPYQVVPLIFDSVVDSENGFIYAQARTGVTYVFQITDLQ